MPAAILFFFLLLGLKPVQQPRPLDQLVLRTLTGEPTRLGDFHSPARVIVFLSPECPLCQQYSRKLTQLAQRKDLSVIGVFPGRAYDRADYEQFKRKYSIDFTLLTDANRSLVRALGATTTPEAFLIDGQGQVLYRGAIDDWVTALGKTRPQARHHYLASAIDAFFAHQPILPVQVSPIGCLINDL
ncbi:hypothetical protein BWI96_00160 [Siphonobacter sp. SORGH_AS_0500]|uniref:redoxin domain-containing protein n=1 Tax=Siphonobacter sp. SORGH_AS_0500 TaxID=1864824 RepID=UPI000CAB20C0|nr:redoxin domain-containing protein [Siphonobacter sp. SORGH_AS_0500]PKK38247.1 hypothetical protein BWI96_00160 [Siphonobacter sp. SORGH_AS_0500]